jgi:hypothetical protein
MRWPHRSTGLKAGVAFSDQLQIAIRRLTARPSTESAPHAPSRQAVLLRMRRRLKLTADGVRKLLGRVLRAVVGEK